VLASTAIASLLAVGPTDEPPAPTPALALQWTAPAECPRAHEVEAAIVEMIGRPLAEDPDRVLHAVGTIEASARGWVLVMRIEDGERRFEAPQCRDLLEPAALVITIAVDAAVDQPPPPGVTPDVEPPPAPPRREPARARRRARSVIGLLGGIDGGNLPAPAGTIAGSVGVMIGRARIEIAALHLFARTIRTASGGGEFSVTAARVQGCFAPGRGALSVPICSGVELGLLRGSGVEVERSNTERKLWLGLVGGAGLAWAVRSQLALVLRAELVVSPLRHEFALQQRPLVTTGAVGGRGLAGLEVRLP
jgi:hypothetical protein